jgi:peptidyl-prolyl cis-trans isomerase SurA
MTEFSTNSEFSRANTTSSHAIDPIALNPAHPAPMPARTMQLRILRFSAALLAGLAPLALGCLARAQANEPASPYGGSVVEDIIARVNDQIISQSDYNRALNDLDQDGRQRGQTMQQMSEERKDLLRNLIDQQLWLSKGKELGVTGETELVKRLDEIRKQYNLASIDDLENAAKQQGVSYEDFKANIRNQIITQNVMRQEVGEHIQMTPGEVQVYYEAHKQDYVQPESERLSEILISTGAPGTADADKLAAAKAKADDVEARLHSGGDFQELARSFSNGPTASQGGELGTYKRGQLGKALEDKTFGLQTGQYTDPILTREGYIILKVQQHVPAGPRPFKDVEQDVEEAYYMSQMEPAIRAYLTKMRDDAFIQIKKGYTDTAATPAELQSSISFSAYVPPSPKKKAKVERTRFRESTHGFRQTSGPVTTAAAQPPPATQPAAVTKKKKNKKEKKEEAGVEKPGKKEKIRYGQAPRETLPQASANSATENAGALPETAANADQPANPLEPTAATDKTRFSDRARAKKEKPSSAAGDSNAPLPPAAAEVADQQTQSTPLGLNGDDSTKKKTKPASASQEKTRYSQQEEKKKSTESQPQQVQQPTPIPPVQGAPGPADAPQPQNSQPQQ